MAQANGKQAPVLSLDQLRMYYETPRGMVRAVDNVSFDLLPGERFGLAGESGSGKSSMALTILRLIKPPARVMGGEIWLDGKNILEMSEEKVRELRLAEISLVAQGSMNSLNPVMRVRDQFTDCFADHDIKLTKQELTERVRSLLAEVGLLSGGMKQRVCIAVAISLRPKVIIADELTSALDVVVQRHVMQTLRQVQERLGAAVILVGHDMGLMAQFVQRLGVMYAGRLVEVSPVRQVFENPQHPYTQLLISSLPSVEGKGRGDFKGIPGLPPSLLDPPTGCVFHPRCPRAIERCSVEVPALREVQPGILAACHLA
jgi:peptide/nickel transport system ATP-binding protein